MDFIGGTGSEWWKLSSRLDAALGDAWRRIDPDGPRRLALGSPVLIGTPDGDQIRVPVIVRTHAKEEPVAYLRVERTEVDRARIDALARRVESLARQVLTGTPAAAGTATEIVYP